MAAVSRGCCEQGREVSKCQGREVSLKVWGCLRKWSGAWSEAFVGAWSEAPAPILSINQIGQPQATDESIMIDSGAATNVSPPWFGTSFPLHQMRQHDKPNLKTVTGTDIWVYWCGWIHFLNQREQRIVIPFYVLHVKQPILSVTRLIHQGFEINVSGQSTMTNPKSFESPIAPMPPGQQLIIRMMKQANNEQWQHQHTWTHQVEDHTAARTTSGRWTTKDTLCAFTSA